MGELPHKCWKSPIQNNFHATSSSKSFQARIINVVQFKKKKKNNVILLLLSKYNVYRNALRHRVCISKEEADYFQAEQISSMLRYQVSVADDVPGGITLL